MDAELKVIASQLEQARTPEELFGRLAGNQAEQQASLKALYHRLAKRTHPDAYRTPEEQKLAQVAFSRLNNWFACAQARIRAGIYGKTGAPLEQWRLVLQTPKGAYALENNAITGPLYQCFPASLYQNEHPQPVMLKITRDPANNDLAENEARALHNLRTGQAARKFSPYLPNLLDSFYYQDDGPARRVNVFEQQPGWYSLEEVRQAYPHGLDPRDMAWVWRRLLVALGFAHLNGILHGAVLPAHVLIQPEQHGLVLSEWSYSVAGPGVCVPALHPDYIDWYPQEVACKEAPLPGTDIGMAARCMIYLLGGDPIRQTLPGSLPQPLRSFFQGCTLAGKRSRPQDAWALKTEFDELIQRLWGERKFHPFSMHVRSERP